MQAKKEIMAKIKADNGMEILLECLLDAILDVRDCLGILRDPNKIFKIQRVPKQPQQPKKAPEIIKHNIPQKRYPKAIHVRLIKEEVVINKQKLSFEKQTKPQVKQTQYKDKLEKAKTKRKPLDKEAMKELNRRNLELLKSVSEKVKSERKPLDKQARTEFRRKVRVRKKRILEKAGKNV